MELNELSAVHTPERWKAALYEKLRQEHPHPTPIPRRLGVILAAALLLLAAAAFAWLVDWNGAADYFDFLAGEDAPAYVDVEQLSWEEDSASVTAYEDEHFRVDVLEASFWGKNAILLLEVVSKDGVNMENCFFDTCTDGHATEEFLFTVPRQTTERYIYSSEVPGMQENTMRVFIEIWAQNEYTEKAYSLWLSWLMRQGETRAEITETFDMERWEMQVYLRERPELSRYVPAEDTIFVDGMQYQLNGFEITPFGICAELSGNGLGAEEQYALMSACVEEQKNMFVTLSDGTALRDNSGGRSFPGAFYFHGSVDVPRHAGLSDSAYMIFSSNLPLDISEIESITVFGKTYNLEDAE